MEFEPVKGRAFPHRDAPIILMHPELTVIPANFSLIPSWSKERRPKFATHNARIETITEKSTWRGPLKNKHCLVPITTFFEAIREGDYKGSMVEFISSETNFAAGLWDEWVDKATGEIVPSFTIITKEADSFIAKIGHDRSPLFLKEDSAKDWLDLVEKPSFEMIDFLNSNVKNIKWDVREERKLKGY